MAVIKDINKNGLYEVIGEKITKEEPAWLVVEEEEDKSLIWHNRLGHISENDLQVLSKQGLLERDQVSIMEFCEHCVMEKQHILSFQAGIHNSKAILDYVHDDLWGPTKSSPQHDQNQPNEEEKVEEHAETTRKNLRDY
ncbi:hypothetical protein UlMin_000475 [Ulmus minor]